jgi:hypothetical protein
MSYYVMYFYAHSGDQQILCCLRLECRIFSFSLDCLFLIALSVFSSFILYKTSLHLPESDDFKMWWVIAGSCLVVGSFLLHSDFLLISAIFINWLITYFLKYFGHAWWKEYGTIVGLLTLFNLIFINRTNMRNFPTWRAHSHS